MGYSCLKHDGTLLDSELQQTMGCLDSCTPDKGRPGSVTFDGTCIMQYGTEREAQVSKMACQVHGTALNRCFSVFSLLSDDDGSRTNEMGSLVCDSLAFPALSTMLI